MKTPVHQENLEEKKGNFKPELKIFKQFKTSRPPT